jgi:hypothetical protein
VHFILSRSSNFIIHKIIGHIERMDFILEVFIERMHFIVLLQGWISS